MAEGALRKADGAKNVTIATALPAKGHAGTARHGTVTDNAVKWLVGRMGERP